MSGYSGPFLHSFKTNVLVRRDDGALERVDAYRCVNVEEDSFLVERFRNGRLNALDGMEEELPVSVVFHVPGSAFVLYVPPPLHGRVFEEAREFLAELARSEEIPSYARRLVVALTREEVLDELDRRWDEMASDGASPPMAASDYDDEEEDEDELPPPTAFADEEAAVEALEELTEEALPSLDDLLDGLPVPPEPKKEPPPPQPEPERPQGKPVSRVWREGSTVKASAVVGGVAGAVLSSSPLRPYIQLLRIGSFPLVVLGVVSEEGEWFAWPLNVMDESHREVLRALSSSFAIDLAVYDEDGRLLGERVVKGILSENVRLILSTIDLHMRVSAPDGERFEEAVERWRGDKKLSAPPTMREDHFKVSNLADPSEVVRALRNMEPWLDQRKEEDLILVHSYPVSKWRALVGQIMEAAFDMGIPMPEPMLRLALEHGLAPNRKELVATLVRNFAETERDGRLGTDVVNELKRRLALLSAEESLSYSVLHTPVPEASYQDKTMEVALEDIEVVEDGEEEEEDEENPEWEALLKGDDETTSPRSVPVETLVEMCRAQEKRGLELVVKAIEERPKNDVVRLMPALTLCGDEAVPHLLRLLESPKAFVRQTAALALGELKDERAIDPLLTAVLMETHWEEFARALARLGPDLYLEVASRIRDISDDRLDRVAYLFALVAVISNDDTPLRTLAQSKDDKVRAAAEKAVEILEDVRREHEEVTGLSPLSEESAAKLISQSFYVHLLDLK